ncbi:MAG: hypothetical protein AUJ49_06040 [Desulfovibrionaceae bacterium CG1_02_65_16]|nr:MAG: hypothetical protein AUJ49_06040 [Desulfovibrionaceae bacterium CG1_02_65_16]
MRKRLFAGVLVSAIVLFSTSLAVAEPIDPGLWEDLAAAIRASGQLCRTCEGGRQWKEPTGRTLLQVYCNRNSRAYRVIVSPAQRVTCVELWDDEGKKCK